MSASKMVERIMGPVTDEPVLYVTRQRMFRAHPVLFCAMAVFPLFGTMLFMSSWMAGKPLTGIYALACGFAPFLVWWLKAYSNVLVVTSKRMFHRVGIISKRVDEIMHQDVRSVHSQQDVLDRLLKVGRVAIGTSGTAGHEVVVAGIDRPDHLKRLLNDARAAV